MAPFIKFKAGRVDFDEETKACTPSPVKGEVSISQNEEADSFFNFVWSPRDKTAGEIESDELLVVPGDVTWKHIQSCNTGRVYQLKFLSSGARHLFWMQDRPEDDDKPENLTPKDIEIAGKIENLFKDMEEDE